MDLLKGSTTYRRFRIAGIKPDVYGEDFAQALSKNAFTSLNAPQEEGVNKGWIGPDHLFDKDLDPVRMLRDPYLVLTLRIDKHKVPRNLLNAHLKVEVGAWLMDQDKKDMPNSKRKEIRDEIAGRLLVDTPPSVASYTAFWNLESGTIYLTTASGSIAEQFREAFRDTFGELGLLLSPVDPFRLGLEILGDEKSNDLTMVEPTAFAAV